MLKNVLTTAAVALIIGGCAKQPAAENANTAAPAKADLALKNGAVYTLDGSRSWAHAVAISGGRIVYVGTDKGLDEYVGASTKVVDLKGRMLLPAFQDVHIHPISAGVEAKSCNLNGLKTPQEYAAAIKKYADEHPDLPWITGGGWLMSAFGPGGMARKEIIDAVVPDRPVYLSSTDGHTTWANSKALALAGITKETPDPRDGRIDRDPKTHEAVGSLQEGAGSLVSKVVPAKTAAQLQDGLRYAVKLLNSYGITAFTDASVDENDLKTYKTLDDKGELTMRVTASIWWERGEGLEQIANIERLRKEYTGGHVDAGTVKIMQDGVLENYTAVMLQPYLKVPGSVRGIPMVDPEKLKEVVTQLDAKGFQVHFHAIGDGAVRQALDAIEAARVKNGDLGHRDHISHLELIDPTDVPRFRELGVIANFQPYWAYADEYITKLTIPFMGPERSSRLYPIGTMQRSGAMVAFGSDWSVSTANPLEEIEAAVTRMGPAGETKTPFLPDERIDLPDALAAFTSNAAYVNRIENKTGSIEVGKLADLVVLDHNLFEIPPTEIAESKALLTLFEGKPVYGDIGAL